MTTSVSEVCELGDRRRNALRFASYRAPAPQTRGDMTVYFLQSLVFFSLLCFTAVAVHVCVCVCGCFPSIVTCCVCISRN